MTRFAPCGPQHTLHIPLPPPRLFTTKKISLTLFPVRPAPARAANWGPSCFVFVCENLCLQQSPEVKLVAICDDVTIVGPIDSCMRVPDRMRNNSRALIGLTVKESKTKILYARTTPPPVAIVEAATSRGMVLARGASKLLGSIVGLDDDAKRAWVLKKID
jgi:hypothetical protein